MAAEKEIHFLSDRLKQKQEKGKEVFVCYI